MDYEALLGLGISDEDRMRVLADRLRGRERAADVFALSTIAPIARGAQAEQQRVQDTGSAVGALRRARAAMDAEAEQNRLNREFERTESELERQAERDEAVAQRQADAVQNRLDRESAETIAGVRSSGKNKPTAAQQTARYRFETFDQGLKDMENLLNPPELGGEGYDPTSLRGLKDKYATRNDALRWAASPEGEQWQSASNTVKEAALRTATGAAAPQGENAEYIATLIPQPFEDDETVAFKMRKLREFREILARLGGATDAEAAANYNTAVEMVRSTDTGGGLTEAERAELAELEAKYGNGS